MTHVYTYTPYPPPLFFPTPAMKALEQRQAALERSEKEVVVAEDELSRLQRGLTEFMSREGVATGETHDARRSVLNCYVLFSVLTNSC